MALLLVAGVGLACFVSYKAGRTDGRQLERAEWQARDLKEVGAANAKIIALTTQYRAAEAKAAGLQEAIVANYQRGIEDGKARQQTVINDLRAGNVRLRVHLAAREGAGGDRPAEAAACAISGDADADARFLHPDDAAFLLGEAFRADDIVRQLSAAQAVIANDRALCR